jgi:hypothetical protein
MRMAAALGDALLRLGDDPGEVLQGGDFKGDRRLLVKGHGGALLSGDFSAIIRQGDKGVCVALGHEPLQIGYIGRLFLFEPPHQALQAASFPGLAVDFIRTAEPVHDLQQPVDQRVVGIQQKAVDLIQSGRRYLKTLS